MGLQIKIITILATSARVRVAMDTRSKIFNSYKPWVCASSQKAGHQRQRSGRKGY